MRRRAKDVFGNRKAGERMAGIIGWIRR